jgi:ATP-dependent Lhr-like helicase
MEADDALSSMTLFGAATRAWFTDRFGGATDVQARGWAAIARGAHALLVAPTGSGKTLAAFLWAIDRLSTRASDAAGGTRVVYVSPLKALSTTSSGTCACRSRGYRSEQGRSRLTAVARAAGRRAHRHGPLRRRQARAPGQILVTTPESLYLMLD